MKFHVAVSTNHPNARPLVDFKNIVGMLVPVNSEDPTTAKSKAIEEVIRIGVTDAQVIGIRLISRED